MASSIAPALGGPASDGVACQFGSVGLPGLLDLRPTGAPYGAVAATSAFASHIHPRDYRFQATLAAGIHDWGSL
jgi:hypothetical protein